MLRRFALIVTTLCVIVSLASPIFAFWIDTTDFFPHIRRYPDGASIGFYARGRAHVLVRRILFPAGMDGEVTYDPLILAFFCIPPLIWLYASRQNNQTSRLKLIFNRSCAACPLAAAVMVSYIRDTDLELLGLGMIALTLFLLIWIIRIAIVTRPPLAERRLKQGLCPNCAYDIRATPKPSGPILNRCPECGFSLVPDSSQIPTPQ